MLQGSKFIAGLIIGVAAGAAAALFLQTEQGKQFTEDVKEKATDTADKVKAQAQALQEELEKLIEKGKQFVADLEKKAEASSQL